MNYSQAVEALTGLIGYISPEPNIHINQTFIDYHSVLFNIRLTEEDIFITSTEARSVIKITPKQMAAALYLQTWLKQKLQTIRDEQERLNDESKKYSLYVYDRWEDESVCAYEGKYKQVLEFCKKIENNLNFFVKENGVPTKKVIENSVPAQTSQGN